MPNQPIDKVHFKKRDIAALHDMPSANSVDQILVRGHHPRHWAGSTARWVIGLFLLLAIVAGGLFAALQTGIIDGFIRDRAQIALGLAVGPDNRAQLSSATIRLTSRGQLALLAQDVVVQRRDGLTEANHAESILIALDPLALLTGRISVSSLDIGGVGLTAPQGDGFNLTDLAGFRIDGTDAMIEQLFSVLNSVAAQVDNVDATAFRFSDIRISGAGEPVVIVTAAVRRLDRRNYEIEAEIERAGRNISITGTAIARAGEAGLSRISGKIGGMAIDFLTDGPRDRQNGVSAPLDISFNASRAGPERKPALSVKARAVDGTMTMGGVAAVVREAGLNLVYMPKLHKIEIMPSILRVGETIIPFTGGLIDADRIEKISGPGIAFDFVASKALAAPGDSNEAPISFDGKLFGRFDAEKKLLVAEELTVSSEQGALFGSASWRFVEGISPEINMVAQIPRMTTAAVKQFWPYWMGKRARQWALDNLYGGMVTEGRIQLAAPAGHYKLENQASFTENQLQIDFDIERTRMNVAGNIPPLRDTVGHMRLRGSNVSFNIDSATAFFPTGRTVDVANATFSIPDTDAQPLMAELAMSVSGNADAVAELISYHPIDALDKIGLEPEELSGEISSQVTARFGLIRGQSPPPPDWTVSLDLKGVDIAKPIDGRILTEMDGSLLVTPERAELIADARVDGAQMSLDVVRPVGQSSVPVRRKLSGTLSSDDREKLAPGSGTLFSGPVGFTLEGGAEGAQLVSLDLKAAKLTVPGIGWVKGEGVAGTLTFSMLTEDKKVRLSDLKLSGKGFEAVGSVTLNQGRLVTADFDRVALSPRDNYRAAISRKGKTYLVKIGGKAIDVRPIITLAKSSDIAAPGGASGNAPVEVTGSVDAIHGYSDEILSGGSVRYKGQGERVDLLDFKAVTRSGQALVIAVVGTTTGETIDVTSGDAGAFARFAGIYSRIRGGLLNVRLKRQDGPQRRGVIDIRNFDVVGEPRLGSLVSTPSKQDGKSLKDAVKADIDVSEARFEVANARVVSGKGQLSVSEGVIRGPQIGASFQGQVYDPKGQIDLTGTFMPAYGVNRLFSELPLIGALLGNGRDRGLIGITFRLAGKTSSPLVEVNPLSVIAPGVFRSIFEYRP